MILVTLGTITYSFDRLIDWVRILLDEGFISESIFIQHGVTDVSSIIDHPLVTTKSLLSLEDMDKTIEKSRLVISHAGQGSTRKLAKTDKPFILVPRISIYKEHVDNHQVYFAKNMSNIFRLCYCTSLLELQNYILNPPKPIGKELFHKANLAAHLLTVFPPDYNDSIYTNK